jgi:ATP-dependent Clp protease adaptor protein ClpS
MTTCQPSTAPRPNAAIDGRATRFPLYRVLLHNDDKNTMEHVVRALLAVFGFEQRVCERLMMEAHRNGVAVCVVEPLEQAELHRDRLKSFSLTATIEPEEGT